VVDSHSNWSVATTFGTSQAARRPLQATALVARTAQPPVSNQKAAWFFEQ
jgi:hypothetical protein